MSVFVWKGLKRIVRCSKEAVKAGRVRKVLVKYDVPVTDSLTRDNLLDQLMEGFQLITPYFDSCQDANKLLEDWCKRGE